MVAARRARSLVSYVSTTIGNQYQTTIRISTGDTQRTIVLISSTKCRDSDDSTTSWICMYDCMCGDKI